MQRKGLQVVSNDNSQSQLIDGLMELIDLAAATGNKLTVGLLRMALLNEIQAQSEIGWIDPQEGHP